MVGVQHSTHRQEGLQRQCYHVGSGEDTGDLNRTVTQSDLPFRKTALCVCVKNKLEECRSSIMGSSQEHIERFQMKENEILN